MVKVSIRDFQIACAEMSGIVTEAALQNQCQFQLVMADILVCHEGPSSIVDDRNGQMMGFDVIDELATKMGAQLIVHGHHHRTYSARLDKGILVRGLGIAELCLWDPGSKDFVDTSTA
ncbi:metallophosphoesterase family protein [Iodidimonas gelatinilytica]|nr:metallophosphoesterase family protein [Iodidimonas gelatinilytica]